VVARHPSFAEGEATVEVDPARRAVSARIVLLAGGRIEGRAYRRDGRRAADAVEISWVGGGHAFPSLSVPITPEGTFVVEHVATRPLRVALVTDTPDGPIKEQYRELAVPDGTTARLDFLVRDIVVSGRVTRWGRPLAGVRVRLSPGIDSPVVATSEPTGEDGLYELVGHEPGSFLFQVETPDGRRPLSNRVEIRDVDAQTVDVPLDLAKVTGTVIDVQSREPIANVTVTASKPESRFRPEDQTDSGGHFDLEVEPGTQEITALHRGYRMTRTVAAVDRSGREGLSIALARNLTPAGRTLALAGRVVTRGGAPFGGAAVRASPSDPARYARYHDVTQSDGSFTIELLEGGRYDLSVRSSQRTLAVLAGATADAGDLTIVVPASARLVLNVLRPDGSPATDAWAGLLRVDGVEAPSPNQRTDGRGRVELVVPSGALELQVDAEAGAMTASPKVTVAGGAVTEVMVRLRATTPRPWRIPRP
jgi:carboxypeptidase family protein